MAIAAQICFLVTTAFFAALAWLGWEGAQRMISWLF
jgi:hypothetical protein